MDRDDADSDNHSSNKDTSEFCTAANESGEICVRIAGLPILGYWANPVASADAVDADGWLRTGDVGRFDVAGNLYVIDRIKDMLKYRNVQIAPVELEACVLSECKWLVAECCVVGVPDGAGSDLVAAVVVRRKLLDGSELDPDEVAEAVESAIEVRFSDAKRLRAGVWFVNRMPLTPSGKVVRRRVQEMVVGWWQERNEKIEKIMNRAKK